jgi:uncharacterized RDD family membrane protein YckC
MQERERNKPDRRRIAGFRIRLSAFLIDALIVWAVAKLVALAAVSFRLHLPTGFYVLLIASYWIILTGWQGQTIGKSLCGLKVLASDGSSLSFARTLLREFIGKIISATPLGAGFIWVAFTKNKRAWHDFLARTEVTRDPSRSGLARLSLLIALGILLISPLQWFTDYTRSRKMAVDTDRVVTAYSQRDPHSLVDVSAIEAAGLDSLARWLDRQGRDPIDYAVETAARHQITIIGERHGQRENLAFINRIIPDLYYRAGVRCIALEACIPEDNGNLEKLVAASEYDHDLALKIARNGDSWKLWGWKGYWDIFETVWRLNQDLPENKKKMRIVGIGVKFDGPSGALAGMGEFTVPGSALEKLRWFTLVDEIARVVIAEALYAANISRETVEKGERGVVLVGAAHSRINQLYPKTDGKKLTGEWARAGFMLHHKYGDQVFQILLHNHAILPRNIINLIESVNSRRDHRPFGCDIESSPFANLRDSTYSHFLVRSGLRLADIATGYIFLKTTAKQTRCEWLDGYISDKMFAKHKRYYELKAERKLHSAREANLAFSTYKGW